MDTANAEINAFTDCPELAALTDAAAALIARMVDDKQTVATLGRVMASGGRMRVETFLPAGTATVWLQFPEGEERVLGHVLLDEMKRA